MNNQQPARPELTEEEKVLRDKLQRAVKRGFRVEPHYIKISNGLYGSEWDYSVLGVDLVNLVDALSAPAQLSAEQEAAIKFTEALHNDEDLQDVLSFDWTSAAGMAFTKYKQIKYGPVQSEVEAPAVPELPEPLTELEKAAIGMTPFLRVKSAEGRYYLEDLYIHQGHPAFAAFHAYRCAQPSEYSEPKATTPETPAPAPVSAADADFWQAQIELAEAYEAFLDTINKDPRLAGGPYGVALSKLATVQALRPAPAPTPADVIKQEAHNAFMANGNGDIDPALKLCGKILTGGYVLVPADTAAVGQRQGEAS